MSAIGQIPHRSDILNITSGLPCTVTTTTEHGYFTHDFVRLTNLNSCIPIPRGMDELNGYKFRIVVTGTDSFYLEDPITFIPIDSTTFPPYVTGGYCNRIEQTFFYYGDP